MATKRTPIKRRSEPKITPTAIRLFDNMRRCRCRGPEECTVSTPCSGCKRWQHLHSDLVDELGTMPWQWPCVQDPNTQNPYPPGTPAHRDWEPNYEAQERWRALAEASREARRQERENRHKAAEPPAAPPEQPPSP